ncbi:MAG: FkbM family methyltransferase, partial [Actinomycetes bacterium]
MSLQVAVRVDADCRDGSPDARLAASRDVLAPLGVDLREVDCLADAEGADLIVRVGSHPRPWFAAAGCLDVAEFADLEACLKILARDGLGETLLRGRPREWRAAVAQRLGPLQSAARLYLFGGGLVGRQAAAMAAAYGVVPAGFLDNDASLHGGAVDGLAVLAPEDADLAGATVVVCTGRHFAEITTQLWGLGAGGVLSLSEFSFLLGSPSFPEHDYFADLRRNRFRYVGLMARVADAPSREVLAAVLWHRLTFATGPLRDVCSDDQWFIPEVFAARVDALFVDGGAYDGDTGAEFIRRNGGVGHGVELFEPDPSLAERAQRRMAGVPGARVHRAGLSARPGVMQFASTGGMDGAIAGNCGETINVLSVDGTVGPGVTYLKLDVEGAEEAALQGARRAIAAAHPVVAVAVYHRAADLWRLPAWLDAHAHG